MADKPKHSVPAHLHLVRDVLDTAVRDREGKHLGRVDRIAIQFQSNKSLRVTRIEMGGAALAERLSARLGRAVHRIGQRFGLHGGRPVRLAWSKVQSVGLDIRINTDKDRSPVALWERWLCTHIIRHIPGWKNK